MSETTACLAPSVEECTAALREQGGVVVSRNANTGDDTVVTFSRRFDELVPYRPESAIGQEIWTITLDRNDGLCKRSHHGNVEYLGTRPRRHHVLAVARSDHRRGGALHVLFGTVRVAMSGGPASALDAPSTVPAPCADDVAATAQASASWRRQAQEVWLT